VLFILFYQDGGDWAVLFILLCWEDVFIGLRKPSVFDISRVL